MPKDAARDTKNEILSLAKQLTQTRGFNWLSFQDLSDRLKIRKASVHYHFSKKSDLGVQIICEYRADFAEWTNKIRAKDSDAVSKIEAYIEMYRKILGDITRICPVGVFSIEWNTLPKEVREELRGLIADHRKFLEETLKAGRKSGAIRAQGSVDEQIAFIGASLQGALQLARVQDSIGLFNAVSRQLRAAILR